jgi:hypothetical protein
MRRSIHIAIILLCLAGTLPHGHGKELLDRVAITIGLEVITEQEIYEQLRIAAFLEGQQPEATQQKLRETADRIVKQRLVLLDMRANGFPVPTREEVEAIFQESRSQLWGSPEAFRNAVREAGFDQETIDAFLTGMVATVKYIDFRFRPSVRISDSILFEKYEELYPPPSDPNAPEPPAFEDVRADIERELQEEEISIALDRWLEDARNRAGVRYLPEVLP